MVWISNEIWYPEAQPFEIWTNGCMLTKTIWNLDKNIWLWMVGTTAIPIKKLDHLKTRPFEIQPSKSPDFKWWDFRCPLYNYFHLVGSPWLWPMLFCNAVKQCDQVFWNNSPNWQIFCLFVNFQRGQLKLCYEFTNRKYEMRSFELSTISITIIIPYGEINLIISHNFNVWNKLGVNEQCCQWCWSSLCTFPTIF